MGVVGELLRRLQNAVCIQLLLICVTVAKTT